MPTSALAVHIWTPDDAKCNVTTGYRGTCPQVDGQSWTSRVAKCIMPHVTREGRQELPLHNATRAGGGAGPGVTLQQARDPWRGFSLIHDIHPHPTLGSGVAISHTRLDARRLSPILGHGGNTNGRCVDYPVPILRGRW